jgi:hypothetical protein
MKGLMNMLETFYIKLIEIPAIVTITIYQSKFQQLRNSLLLNVEYQRYEIFLNQIKTVRFIWMPKNL